MLAVVQALLDNLLGRGLDPSAPGLFIVDGAKALTKAIRNTFGHAAAIQRCQVHKGRNIKRWRNAEMALGWTAAGLPEASKTFRRPRPIVSCPSSETLSRSP